MRKLSVWSSLENITWDTIITNRWVINPLKKRQGSKTWEKYQPKNTAYAQNISAD